MDDRKKSEKSKKVAKSSARVDNKKHPIKENFEKMEDDLIEKAKLEKTEKFNAELNDNKSKTVFNLIEVIIIMTVTTLFGLLLGALIVFVRIDGREVSCSAIRKDMVEFAGVYDDLLNEYYGDIDKDELMGAAMKGMISYLQDPHSAYIEKTDAVALDDTLNGSFIGIGVEIVSVDGNLPYITKIFEDGPAFNAGLLVGDVLTKVEEIDLSSLSLAEIVSLIKTDKKGEVVNITVLRDSEFLDFSVTRDIIELKSVTGYNVKMDGNNIGVLSISSFAKNTYSQFKDEYLSLKESGVTSLIVDVRNNSGGYLSSAKDVASMFLNSGEIVYQKGDKNNYEEFLSESEKEIDLPVVIVANGGTASSAEVFVGALKENLSVQVVGSTTYGKGTIQKLHNLASGGYVKYTVQFWLTPNGVNVDGVGIEPTLKVELSNEYWNNPVVDNDNQLQQAIRLLVK